MLSMLNPRVWLERKFLRYYESHKDIVTPDPVEFVFLDDDDMGRADGRFFFYGDYCQIMLKRGQIGLGTLWWVWLHEYRHYQQWRQGQWGDQECRKCHYEREADADEWACTTFEEHFRRDFKFTDISHVWLRIETFRGYARTLRCDHEECVCLKQ